MFHDDQLLLIISYSLKRNLPEKEEEMKEITKQLQALAKDNGIQGDSLEDIIRHISRSYT